MTADPVGPDPFDDRLVRWLPWVRLFRGVSLSFDGRKLVLAALGLMLLNLGGWGLDAIFELSDASPPRPIPRLVSEQPDVSTWSGLLATSARLVSEPMLATAQPFARLLDPTARPAELLRAALGAFGTVLVWGLLGGAITRIALMDLAGTSWIGVGQALTFAGRRAVSLVGAPLCPLIAIGFFAALCALLGLLYWIPGPVGATIAGLLAFLPLLAGLVMALITIGLAVGWPLMIATIAAEDEDAFDALSRSYSYVFLRPWRLAGYGLLAWGLGVVGFLFVRIVAGLVVQLALWGLVLGGPDEPLLRFFHTGADAGTPGAIHAFWIGVVELLAFGWIYAYFWSAASIIYLLLRADIDGAPFEQIRDSRSEPAPILSDPLAADVGAEKPPARQADS